ncbi:MAG: hypothetical protein QM817_16010 [Archangium sp.]
MRRVLLVLLLASCGVEATKPLTPASGSKPDPSLTGTWIEAVKGKQDITITVKATGALLHIEVTGERDPMIFEGHVSVLSNDVRIVNLREFKDGKAKGNYLFLRYVLNADGTLDTWLVSDKLASAALNDGTLKGKRGQYGGVTLDETPEKMIAFILKGKREEIFEPLLTLKRKP